MDTNAPNASRMEGGRDSGCKTSGAYGRADLNGDGEQLLAFTAPTRIKLALTNTSRDSTRTIRMECVIRAEVGVLAVVQPVSWLTISQLAKYVDQEYTMPSVHPQPPSPCKAGSDRNIMYAKMHWLASVVDFPRTDPCEKRRQRQVGGHLH